MRDERAGWSRNIRLVRASDALPEQRLIDRRHQQKLEVTVAAHLRFRPHATF
jgi:hypothetical protein